jgi:WD40 repeat protein/serine/threonine protein kinase
MSEASIFAAALEKTGAEERAAYLAGACADDARLRRRVEALLRAHAEPDEILDAPGPRACTVDAPLTERPGAIIGPYKLLQQIGEGGMGVVYMAEQEKPVRRKVALKIIKPGMDNKQVIARFEAERQALAMMDHQNIAKVLDAGTTESGRPYFVMELVHGVPLTNYCDDHQLTPRQRLELFIPVCHALQHAHQKGIIHRDLKPSNILVTMYDDKPVPKVIDFGVAKAVEQRLTEKTLFTQFGTLVGTFEYMSPEQAEMNAFGMDTRSDVYSLGVLLYELLTGTTPLERGRLREAAYADIVRLIKEEEPPPPSTRLSSSGVGLAGISQQRGSAPEKLTQLVRGELDWIVMRCLEKDRTRRYETANGLARDVERYLKDEPVEACPPTAGYRLRKFARKNKRLLATAAAFAALLLLGVAASAWQAMRATQAEAAANENSVQAQAKEREAEQQRDDAKALAEKLREAQEQQRTILYAAHMNLTRHVWEEGVVDQAAELLELHRPKSGEMDLRGFEWHYLYRLCHSDLLTLKGHTGGVGNVVYSPDGKHLASFSFDDNTVKVWDAQTGQQLLSLPDRYMVTSVAYSPDGKHLATSSLPGVVKVWDAQTGQEIRTLQKISKEPVRWIAFSPDNKCLAGTTDFQGVGDVKVWDAQTGEVLLTLRGQTGSPRRVAYSPVGKRLASSGKDVKLWDAETGKELLTLQGHTGPVGSVAFSPDGKRLASGGNDVKVWDAETGKELLTVQGHTGPVRSVAFSPDGKRLASASRDRTVKVWDVQTGRELFTLKGHSGYVNGVSFSPDGKRLATASQDTTVKVWDAQGGQEPRTLLGQGRVLNVAVSLDGKRLATVRLVREPGKGPAKEVKVLDPQTGEALLTLHRPSNTVWCVALSPDGKRLATGGVKEIGGGVKVWDAQTGKELLPLKGDTRAITSVCFSPDGKRLASTSVDQTVKVWDAQTGEELLSLQGGGSHMTFSPDGTRLASASSDLSDKTVTVFDAQTGKKLQTLPHPYTPLSVAYSPDGKRLATAGSAGMKVWDAETGKETLTLKGHAGFVSSVAYSPDGKRLASASEDKTVKVWDAQTGRELLTLKGHSGSVIGVVFTTDGHRLVSGAQDGTLIIWDATPLPEKR